VSSLRSRVQGLGSRSLGSLGFAVLEGAPAEGVARVIESLRPRFPPDQLVRIGGPRDGGYLVPRDIDSYELLISPGVGESCEFDRHFFGRGVPAVLVDASVDVPAQPHMVHLKKFVGGYSSEADGIVSLQDLLAQYGEGKSRIVLQMDIEGAEYEVLAATPEPVLGRFGIIAMEAHHLGGLCYRGMFPIIATAFRRLLKNHFVAHIHVNNSGAVLPYRGNEIPDTVEFTFLHRALYQPVDDARFASPHALDAPCLPGVAETPVPRSWWQAT
jgi:hypothetical protein